MAIFAYYYYINHDCIMGGGLVGLGGWVKKMAIFAYYHYINHD
jgi:hypothetical protein